MARPDGAGRRLLFLLATGFGSGWSPFAPGTAGTLAVIPVHLLLALWLPPVGIAVVAVLFVPLAILAAGVGGRQLDRKDPPPVVVDEWAGYLVTVAGHPPSIALVAAAFLTFRLFDILKPFPCRRLEHLPGGYGIVLDDIMAGVYANLTLWILFALV